MRKLLLMITGIMTAAMLAGCTTKEDEGEVSLFNKKMIVGTDIAFDDITDFYYSRAADDKASDKGQDCDGGGVGKIRGQAVNPVRGLRLLRRYCLQPLLQILEVSFRNPYVAVLGHNCLL